MTFPNFPFRPGTPLFPTHEYVEQYHRDFAEQFNLRGLIRVDTRVTSARWVGDGSGGVWNVSFSSQTPARDGEERKREEAKVEWSLFDHLIVANGHNHYPNIPRWAGQEAWLEAKEGREIIHSIFWRNGTKYEGKNVVVVGGGASGRDIVLHTSTYCRKVRFKLFVVVPMVSDIGLIMGLRCGTYRCTCHSGAAPRPAGSTRPTSSSLASPTSHLRTSSYQMVQS